VASHNPSNWCGCDKCRSDTAPRVSGCPHYPGCSCHEARRDADIAALRTELEAERTRANNVAAQFGAAYKEAGELRSKLRRFKGWRVRYEAQPFDDVKLWETYVTDGYGECLSRKEAIRRATRIRNSERTRNVRVMRVFRRDRGAK
jgi:hypothetical protein